MIQDVEQSILLVCPEGREEETITRLARVGFDQTLGYLKGGFETWKKAGKNFDTISSIPANEFAETLLRKPNAVFDVRKDSEYLSQHMKRLKLKHLINSKPGSGFRFIECDAKKQTNRKKNKGSDHRM